MLSTVERVKIHLGLPLGDTSKDAKIERILKGASAWIEKRCSRSFGIDEREEVHDGDDTDTLQLRCFPVDPDAAFELQIDGVEIDVDEELESGALVIDYAAGIVTRDGGFDEGEQNVTVTYTAGFVLPGDGSGEDAQTLPDDIELAAIRLTARVYERSTAEGATNASAGSMSVGFAAAIDEDIKETIDTHSRVIIS